MAYIENIPTVIKEAGKEYNLFMSGDEFVHYLHDDEGNRIMQSRNGFYYYAINDSDGNLVTSRERVFAPSGRSERGLIKARSKTASIPDKEYKRRTDEFYATFDEQDNIEGLSPAGYSSMHHGVVNNIVVYIRFSDDTEGFNNTFSTLASRWNGETNSVRHYFKEVSYNKTDLMSYHFPKASNNVVMSYQDQHPRSYYLPYSTTNPDGYTNAQRVSREHTLLKNAVEYIRDTIPTNINLDTNNNGRVDSVSFIIKGSNSSWGSILWAHRWALYAHTVTIHGKRVWDYTFQPENQASRQILSHEMFHVFGAPDLYRYSGGTVTPVGSWCLMHSGVGHMLAYMKYAYTRQTWIEHIPEITKSGTYTINDISKPTNNCFMIKSPKASEYFIIEYKNKGKIGTYEYNPYWRSGLLIYRINSSVHPNGNRNGPPDEVYIYRPNGTSTFNGSINFAPFAKEHNNTLFNDNTNPRSFLSDNTDGKIDIRNISESGDTMSFEVHIEGSTITTSKIAVMNNPDHIGTVSGSGEYENGKVITVSANV